jgi:hypothetical protein
MDTQLSPNVWYHLKEPARTSISSYYTTTKISKKRQNMAAIKYVTFSCGWQGRESVSKLVRYMNIPEPESP